MKFFGGENVELVPNVTDKSITVNVANADEHVYVRYSAYADGHDFVVQPTSKTPYMGLAITFSEIAPTQASDYHWILVGVETSDIPQMSVNWTTGELEYTGTVLNFYVDNDGYLHWGIQ